MDVEAKRIAAGGQRRAQLGARPVQNRHEIVADRSETLPRKVAQRLPVGAEKPVEVAACRA